MAHVRVPQSSGEIAVAHDGNEPITYAVKNHLVDVDDVVLAAFLATVPGAKPTAAPATTAKTTAAPTAATKER